MTRAYAAGELVSVSASQISEFRSCRRKWRLNKIERVPQPQSPNQAEGERIHSLMERYYEEGVIPDHPAASALVLSGEIPHPTAGLLVEQPRDFGMDITAAGVRVKGRVDLTDPTSVLSEARVDIYDWKSSGSPGFKYALTPDDLARDVQGVIYSYWAMTKWPTIATTTFSHGYISTRAGSSDARLVTSDPLEREYVTDTYRTSIEGTVREMVATAALPEWRDAEPNWGACRKYGGCPYRDVCSGARDIRGDFTDVVVPVGADVWAAVFGGTTTSTEGGGMAADDLGKKLAARRKGNAEAGAGDLPTGVNPPDAAPPQKSVLPEKLAAELAATTGAATGATVTSTPAPACGATSGTHATLVLYVDCSPVRGVTSVVHLTDEIARRSGEILAEAKTAPDAGVRKAATNAVDVRELPFGTGTAALVASFRRTPPTGPVVASSGGLSTLVLEVLEPQADVVVRGGR